MPNTSPQTTAIIKLTPEQADKVSALARAQNKDETAIIEQLLSHQLDLMPRPGPGHTRAEIILITKNSSLADIMDPNSLSADAILGQLPKWTKTRHNQPLLTQFTIDSSPKAKCPYMDATFFQDPGTPHHWRAVLSPRTRDIGKLGDLPQHLYPHPSLYDAAEALYQAYTERHGVPDPAQVLRRTLQGILYDEKIQASQGAVTYESTVLQLHPEVDIGLLCQCYADNLGNAEDTINDYMTVIDHEASER